jgi:hypothetical protein
VVGQKDVCLIHDPPTRYVATAIQDEPLWR